jgi:hypothetical protein
MGQSGVLQKRDTIDHPDAVGNQVQTPRRIVVVDVLAEEKKVVLRE